MQPTIIGLDLAKHVFQLHGVDAAGKVVVRKRLRRSEVKAFFAKLSPCVHRCESNKKQQNVTKCSVSQQVEASRNSCMKLLCYSGKRTLRAMKVTAERGDGGQPDKN